jgi:putative inorganic carbon (hco3(-)) transporter
VTPGARAQPGRDAWRRVALAGVLALIGAGVVAAAAATADQLPFPLVMGGVAALALGYLAFTLEPAWTFSAAIALSVLSGNSQYLGLPVGPDRVALAMGLLVLLVRSVDWTGRRDGDEHRLRFTATHWLLLIAAAYATLSAAWAGSLTEQSAAFGLLDRFGLVPFALFALAPKIFPTERERMVLVTTLVVLGLYLGVTAVLEGLGLTQLVFPRYIADQSVGMHFGRARGPFVEAVANGLALFGCATASAVAFTRWRRPWARRLAVAVLGLCLLGILFTLTRAVWIATVIVPLAVMLSTPALRRFAAPAALAGVVLLGAAYLVVPGLSEQIGTRASSQRPVWDRLNTNAAAIRMVEERPLFGFGWDRFVEEGPDHMRQAADFPITGIGLNVHNVPLSHAVELGLVGLLLWALAFAAAILVPALRRGPPEMEPYRLGLLALALTWMVTANFGPLGYAFPTLLLWTWAGMVWSAREEASG